MNVNPRRFEIGICPYDDGSGYKYTITVHRDADETVISLDQHSWSVQFSPERWKDIKAAVEAAIAVLNSEPKD